MLKEIHKFLIDQSKNPEKIFQCELNELWEEKLVRVGGVFTMFQDYFKSDNQDDSSTDKWKRFVSFPQKQSKLIEAKIRTLKTANAVRNMDHLVDSEKPLEHRPRCVGNELRFSIYSSVSLLDLFKHFLSPDYIEPDDIKLIREQLEGAWFYHRYVYPTMDFVPLDVYLRLDFVMHKVICQALRPLDVKYFEMVREDKRIIKSIWTKAETKEKLGDLIAEEFHKLRDSTKKGSQGRIVDTIFNKLNRKAENGEIDPKNYGGKDGKPITSRDTIRRRLKEKNLI